MTWNWFFVQCQQHKNAIWVRSRLFFILQVFRKNCENCEEMNRAAHNFSPETSGRQPLNADQQSAMITSWQEVYKWNLFWAMCRGKKRRFTLWFDPSYVSESRRLSVHNKWYFGLNRDPVLKRLVRFNIHRNTLSPGDLACLCCFYFLCPGGCWHWRSASAAHKRPQEPRVWVNKGAKHERL